MNYPKIGYSAVLCTLLFLSCSTSNTLFKDLKPGVQSIDSIKQSQLIRINPGERIFIHVTSPDPTVTAFLNPFPAFGTSGQQSGGYLVNAKGEITLPLVGIMKVDGFTSEQLADTVKKKLEYYFKDPYVYVNLAGRVYFMNGRSGTVIPMNNERLTIMEAFSQSGNQEAYDRKNEVWLIREENGQRTFAQVDLTKRDIFESPYYYLHNNDVIYLKPGKYSYLNANSPLRSVLTAGAFLLTFFFAIRKI